MIDFVGIYYDSRGYRVHVAEFANVDAPVLEIDFRHGNLAQRSMDEGAFLAMVAEASGPVGPVVTVTGSDFLDWFHQQSCGIYSLDEVKHVAILTQNEWVEVLCLELPTVRKLDSAVCGPSCPPSSTSRCPSIHGGHLAGTPSPRQSGDTGRIHFERRRVLSTSGLSLVEEAHLPPFGMMTLLRLRRD
jgi:hypothetical protein